MKQLVFLSKESVFGGYLKSNICELVDSLGATLNSSYKVSIICLGNIHSFAGKINKLQRGDSLHKTRFVKMDYYFLEPDNWNESFNIIENLKPDILHITSDVQDIFKVISRPERVIYTFDNLDVLEGQEEALLQYDAITATSNTLLELALSKNNRVSEILITKGAVGINNGLLVDFFSPEKGLFLPKTYNSVDQSGKEICKKKLQKTYGIPEGACIYLTGTLPQNISLESIIKIIPTIKETGGYLIIATRARTDEESYLRSLKLSDHVIYLGDSLNIARLPTLVAGADYFIQPDDPSLGSFVPLASCHYGTIPIVSLNNLGLVDIFNDSNAIIVENGDFESAIYKANNVYGRKTLRMTTRTTGMEEQHDWKIRKNQYVQIYEQEKI